MCDQVSGAKCALIQELYCILGHHQRITAPMEQQNIPKGSFLHCLSPPRLQKPDCHTDWQPGAPVFRWGARAYAGAAWAAGLRGTRERLRLPQHRWRHRTGCFSGGLKKPPEESRSFCRFYAPLCSGAHICIDRPGSTGSAGQKRLHPPAETGCRPALPGACGQSAEKQGRRLL